MHVLFTESLIFFPFFHIFNLGSFAWFWVCSGDLVSATPPTVLYWSLWNFTGILIIVWRYAYVFYRILIFFFFFFFFFQIFHIFNLDFFHASILWKCISRVERKTGVSQMVGFPQT